MQQVIYKSSKSNSYTLILELEFKNLTELGDYLIKNKLRLINPEKTKAYNIESKMIITEKDGNHIIFYHRKLIEQFDNNNDIFLDGTFRVIPRRLKGCMQLLTIMARKNDVVSIKAFELKNTKK